jgi:Na+-transporting methylmalonyl-CoA/oxaloacetate decarboxylase gamma subunit
MLQQSLTLTVLGMAVVFAFLWLMVICVNGAGKNFQGKEHDRH